jgi:hypothetical protein
MTVWLDAKTLLPLKRLLLPDTGPGEKLSYTEVYSEFTLDPATFELPR